MVERGDVPEARARRGGSREYVFVDEWEVAAPREAVFDALADARTYPRWWRPVYIDVEADGEPALGHDWAIARAIEGLEPYVRAGET